MDIKLILNSMWVLIAAILVFIMHAGFSLVEIGFTQSKNAVNIIMKNFITVAIGVICFFFVGYGVMYGTDFKSFIGVDKFLLFNAPDQVLGVTFEVYFFFQAIFCATCATIVSGAVAERMKFSAYIIFCVVATTVIYPIIGHWIWGGGFLSQMGFRDFAGGTAVHSIGGVAALVAAKMVGPRYGKYKNDKIKAIPGHNIPLGALGVLILWFGWFGFNAGSTLDITSELTSRAAINTILAGSSATLMTMAFSKLRYKKPDAGLTLNGALAGLVGVTAGATMYTFIVSILVGIISGIVMIFSVEIVEKKFKIDDPVGAISVHAVCGILGSLFIGLFATDAGLFYGGGVHLLGIQAFGVIVACLTSGILTFITFGIIKKISGIRVSDEEQIEGLDIGEHGISAYHEL